METMSRTLQSSSIALLLFAATALADLPDGYWRVEQSQPILDATLRVRLDPDLSHLSGTEFQALEELLAAGQIMQTLYENQLHRGAAAAKAELYRLNAVSGGSTETQNLLDLFYLSKGPVVTTLDNDRVPILPTDAEQPGKNVYPFGLTRAEIDRFITTHPEKSASIKDLRSVVRRATEANLAADIARLDAYPAVDALHDGLRARLASEPTGDGLFYAVPYALAYAAELGEVRRHLLAAARLSRVDSPDFAAYLDNRARDLLSGNYESGDASWVSGEFANLNIQIGSYETYDDALLGAKAFFSASVLARDVAKSEALAKAMADLQDIENSLPYDHQKKVRTYIPVGVYRVIADFGQARGANTATILPNDADHARKYGRTILIRYNILNKPELIANHKKLYDSVMHANYSDDLTGEGSFNRVLWHEVGHYLGVDTTADGKTLNEAFADTADLLEELKSDLVSLFAAPALLDAGYFNEAGLRGQYASGIHRALLDVRPRPDQPYQIMRLMQFNFFMELGLLEPDAESGALLIHYDRYHGIVSQMLEQVLQIHYSGDYALAREFIERWNYWDEHLHGRLAERIRAAGIYRRTMVRYNALGD
jgi:hypothetical protein